MKISLRGLKACTTRYTSGKDMNTHTSSSTIMMLMSPALERESLVPDFAFTQSPPILLKNLLTRYQVANMIKNSTTAIEEA